MSKERRNLFSLLACAMVGITLLFGACLNPVSFNPDELPTIKVEISGSVSANVTLEDVAVFWLINRTKNVKVLEFNIDRPKIDGEADEDYAYPKNVKDMPGPGTSLASYHAPTEKVYQISVAYQIEGGATGAIGPLDVQFPRAQDYRYYLYWTEGGELVLVNEDKMQTLPPDPGQNYPDPEPSSVNAHTLVVINVTPDQNLDGLQFVKNSGGSIYVLQGKPRSKDQARILLGTGDYNTIAFYTRNGPQETDPKTTIITAESGSMAVRTNYLYFYKTKSGGYTLTPVWPPIANDASDENKPEDALDEDQGILEITNNATPSLAHDLVARVNIDGEEYPSTTNNLAYMVPGDVKTYILPVGTVYVSFKPTDQTYYGQTIPREITPRGITRLSYTNNMGNPDFVPDDPTGNGAGLIRITNNTTGVVDNVTIHARTDLSKYISISYEDFTPPLPIQYHRVGRAAVYGTDEFPLTAGVDQLIQVRLETNDGMVVIERVAALRGQIVDIVIEDGSLNPASRIGSKVNVINQTTVPTNIMGMYVANQASGIANINAMYYLGITNPGSKSVYVLSSTGVPIVAGELYKATLSVYGNGNFALIEKLFDPNGELYSTTPDSHLRTITLVDADLPPELREQFVAVNDITIAPSPYTVNVYYTTDLDGVSNPVVTYSSDFNLQSFVTVQPSGATTTGPIRWSIDAGGASGRATVETNTGAFRVNHPGNGTIPVSEADRTVTVRAHIDNAAGTATAKTPFEDTVKILLVYQRSGGYTPKPVTDFDLTVTNVQVEEHATLDLKTLVTSITPPGAIGSDGVPVTADHLTWAIISNANGSLINNGSILAAGTAGTITVRATMPGSKTQSGNPITKDVTITITSSAPPFVGITSITTQDGFSSRIDYYTRTVNNSKTVYASDTLALGVKFNPPNATNKSPLNWSLISGATGAVELSSNPDQIKVRLGSNIPNPNSVTVKVTIPNGKAVNVDATLDVPITLVEHHSRPVQSGEIELTGEEIFVGGVITLSTLVTKFPADAKVNNSPVTVGDLEWSLDGGPGIIQSGYLAGTAVGTITVRATLPADKNLGSDGPGAISATTTINVKAKPPTYPQSVTFRLFKVKESGDTYDDTVTGIYAAMANYPNDYFTNAVMGTGHLPGNDYIWATDSDKIRKDKALFESSYLDYWYKPGGVKKWWYQSGLSLKASGTSTYDLTLNWPDSGYTGYNIFFSEGDKYIRGYANPWGKLDPPSNRVFYLNFKYLYENYLIPMVGKNQVAEGTSGAVKVIPIYYNSERNVGAVMKPQGVNKQPVYDYKDISK